MKLNDFMISKHLTVNYKYIKLYSNEIEERERAKGESTNRSEKVMLNSVNEKKMQKQSKTI